MMRFAMYANAAKPKAWYTVAVFEREPDESPRTNHAGHELAKFAALGDAYAYAETLIDRSANPDSSLAGHALIVIR